MSKTHERAMVHEAMRQHRVTEDITVAAEPVRVDGETYFHNGKYYAWIFGSEHGPFDTEAEAAVAADEAESIVEAEDSNQ